MLERVFLNLVMTAFSTMSYVQSCYCCPFYRNICQYYIYFFPRHSSFMPAVFCRSKSFYVPTGDAIKQEKKKRIVLHALNSRKKAI